ncbi:hypothetical protein V8F33_006829 [Rhypophila sp. PSN 637]
MASQHTPDQENHDPMFFRYTGGGRYQPVKHWCFLAEIVSVEYSTHWVLTVKSGGRSDVRVAFDTDDEWTLFNKSYEGVRPGYTVAVLHATQHNFSDVSTGVRVGNPFLAQIIPMTLAELLALNDRVQKYSPRKGASETTCNGCDAQKQKTSMQMCGKCSMVCYCGKNCQIAGWQDKDHKNDCKIIKFCGLRAMFSLDWSHYNGRLGFPLCLSD